MADNTVLNTGTGGDTLRDLQDGTGKKWPVATVCYATTILDGANVLQIVTPSFGLPVAQQGTWTVTANAGTGTFAVSAATLPLPTGAATAARQAVPGTAGTASADVLTVQGIAGMIAFKSAASSETSTIYNGQAALTPQFAPITASASGATTIVAAVLGKQIRVLRWSLTASGIVNVKWQSHVLPTDLTGLHYLAQYSQAAGSFCPCGLFQTVSGEALDLNLSAAVAVGGYLVYVLL